MSRKRTLLFVAFFLTWLASAFVIVKLATGQTFSIPAGATSATFTVGAATTQLAIPAAATQGSMAFTMPTPPAPPVSGDPLPFIPSVLQAKITFAGSQTIYAGMAVEVNATGSTLDAGTPLAATYTWNFGNGSTSTGWSGGSAYPAAGNFPVSLTVTSQSGKVSTATATVSVLSAASLKSIYVSTAGKDSNPGTQALPIQSGTQLNKMLGNNEQVFFSAGQVFNLSAPINLNKFSNVIVGAYGTGATPVLNFVGTSAVANYGNTAIITMAGATNVAINGLAFTSAFAVNAPNGITPVGTNIAGYNCTFSKNIGDCFLLNSSPNGVVIQNNSAPAGMQSYFAYMMGSNLVFQGNTVGLPGSLTQHVLRSDGTTDVFIGFNNFSTVYGSTLDLQIGSYTYVTHNTLAGPSTVGPLQNSAYAPATTWIGWTCFENNACGDLPPGGLGVPGVSVGLSSWHTAIRNNSFSAKNNTCLVTGATNAIAKSPVNVVNDTQILNNTGNDSGTFGNFVVLNGLPALTAITGNNWSAPKLVIGTNAACPILVTSADLSGISAIGGNTFGYGTAKTVGGLPGVEIVSSQSPWQGAGIIGGNAFNLLPPHVANNPDIFIQGH